MSLLKQIASRFTPLRPRPRPAARRTSFLLVLLRALSAWSS